MNNTPNANRIHIAVLGKRNSGKSSLVNLLAGGEVSIVSPHKGTTTDPVFKAMEIHGIGACVLIDTAGFDDQGELGNLRVIKTRQVINRADVVVIVVSDSNLKEEQIYYNELKKLNIPTIFVINKIDIVNASEIENAIKAQFNTSAVKISALTKQNLDSVFDELKKQAPKGVFTSITGHLISEGSLVLLVMPQDIQAPRGRLILPQVQTIRDLLDNKAVVVSVTLDNLKNSLDMLKKAPDLIITDSQVFKEVNAVKPDGTPLTSFSVLFARYKGDIDEYAKGAESIDKLKPGDSVLIAESCSHTPLDGDIARAKIPALLEKKAGGKLNVTVCSGASFPEQLEKYSLVIMCGGCMFNRAHILSRISRCKEQNVPVTNYGIAIAHMTNVPFTG